jgi:hypothetical protein
VLFALNVISLSLCLGRIVFSVRQELTFLSAYKIFVLRNPELFSAALQVPRTNINLAAKFQVAFHGSAIHIPNLAPQFFAQAHLPKLSKFSHNTAPQIQYSSKFYIQLQFSIFYALYIQNGQRPPPPPPSLPSSFPIPLPCALSAFFRGTNGRSLSNLEQ